MVSTFCLNPCFDKTVEVSALKAGGTNRILRSRVDPGGKGLNVARALSTLGVETTCVCALPEKGRDEFMSLISDHDLQISVIPTPGTVRTNTKILSMDTGSLTELNEAGVPLSSKAMEEIVRMEESLKSACSMHVLSGSLPPHASVAMYYNMIRTLAPAPVFLDTSGQALLEGIKARPLFVKPNLTEMETVFDRPLRTHAQVRDAAMSWIDLGVGHVCVSMGSEGALLITREKTIFSPALSVPVGSPVGSGDAMVAGLVYGYLCGGDLEEILRCATAAAAASCMTSGTQMVRREDYEAMLKKAEVRTI